MYITENAVFEPITASQTHHIIWNLLLSDKQLELKSEVLQNEKIGHIIAILPHVENFLELNKEISSFPYTVMEYGDEHTERIDKNLFNKIGEFIDSIAINTTNANRNVLIFVIMVIKGHYHF